MKLKQLLFLVLMLVFIPTVLAGTVTRSFNQMTVTPGGTVEVTLAVVVGSEDQYYGIEEIYPQGWVVTDAGTLNGATAGKLKKIISSDPVTLDYVYTLTAPATASGSAVFSGTYSFGTDVAIAGQTNLNIGTGPSACAESDWTSVLSPAICPDTDQQTKTWTKSGTCTGGVSHPAVETVTCTYTAGPSACAESDWTSVLSPAICPDTDQQTKTWTKSGTCTGGVTHPDTVTITCTYNAPAELESAHPNAITKLLAVFSAKTGDRTTRLQKISDLALKIKQWWASSTD